MAKRFTGWHATGMLVAFFGIVIAVNVVMATMATGTFGGTVVDNSYVASQRYNDWLAAAREQESYGWAESIGRSGDRAELTVTAEAGPLAGARIEATAIHPLGRSEPIALRFEEIAEGVYRSREVLPEGRWLLQVEIESGNRTKRVRAELL